jgi:hypothetical protein
MTGDLLPSIREIHVAGPMIEFVQRCARCGEVLSDYRNAMYPEGDPPPRGWAAGAHIEIERGFPTFSTVVDDAPTCDEAPRARE